MNKINAIDSMTRKEFSELVARSQTRREVIIGLGISDNRVNGSHRKRLDARIERDKVDTSHFKKRIVPTETVKAGVTYNLLSAIEPAGKNKHNRILWKFSCECGVEKVALASDVVSGSTKSCGCLVRGGNARNCKRHPVTGAFLAADANDTKPGWLIAAYAAWGGSKHHYNEGCSFEDFLRLSQEPCYYCGTTEKLNHLKRKGETFYYNGLDRLDPTLNHCLDNVVPCCKDCNYGKHTKQYDKFLLWIDRVYHHSLSEINRVKTKIDLAYKKPQNPTTL